MFLQPTRIATTNEIATIATVPARRGHPFLPGNAGKPRGARSKSSQYVEQFVIRHPEDVKAIVEKTIEAAKSGKLGV